MGDDSDGENLCFLCLEKANICCEFCSVSACTKSHLAIHRPGDYCFPFRVREKVEVGRYVVATRDISPMEVILEDSPAVFGPEHDTVPVCLECLKRVDGSYLCSKCGLPLCGPQCEAEGRFHSIECPIFADTPTGYQLKVKFGRERIKPEEEAYAPEYSCIAPLRLLAQKWLNPELWNRVNLLMDHDQERRRETKFWAMFQRNVVDFLLVHLGLDYNESEVLRVIGILRTNAFFVEDTRQNGKGGGSGRAVYPTFSFLSHSCACNARYSVLPNKNVLLRAQVPISSGEEITIQYISFMYGHLRRKRDIRECWFFDCKCQRCLDPEELGSKMSAMKCVDESCDGDVLPRKGEDFLEDDWHCSICAKRQSVASIVEFIEGCQKILLNTEGNDVLAYETILEDFSKHLRPTHYLILTVKKFLGDLYGLTEGFTYRELSRKRFDLKISYLKDFIEVISKVDPGYTKWRGLALHALNRPLMYRANGTYKAGHLSKDSFLECVSDICSALKECLKCLEGESEGTREYDVAKVAQDDFSKLSDLILFSKFI